ncbi:MAG: hypothetical protein AVO38_06705 [delta proteobacterium ML8_D]|nr:MAG: hypothetical protein AVO38_06705 [delta proteobacterium ML8_D]
MKVQSPNHQITKSPNFSATGIVLHSGGLDSTIACKVLQAQGIHIIALYFITPFFGCNFGKQKKVLSNRAMIDQGIEFQGIDISDVYLKMIKNPEHGYGKHMNPCIDCRILMIRNAINRLDEFNASFVATGEVLGQRPMSQRRDALRIIERESGADGQLLRPLSALHLPPTDVENKGVVDRSRLLGLTGRGRKDQIILAEKYGIKHYPAPAGGCVLADPILSLRFKYMFRLRPELDVNDCMLLKMGRHFVLPDGSWLVIGRDKRENTKLISIMREGDIKLDLTAGYGPKGLWRNTCSDVYADLAAALLCRYARIRRRLEEVRLSGPGTENVKSVTTCQASDEIVNKYKV